MPMHQGNAIFAPAQLNHEGSDFAFHKSMQGDGTRVSAHTNFMRWSPPLTAEQRWETPKETRSFDGVRERAFSPGHLPYGQTSHCTPSSSGFGPGSVTSETFVGSGGAESNEMRHSPETHNPRVCASRKNGEVRVDVTAAPSPKPSMAPGTVPTTQIGASATASRPRKSTIADTKRAVIGQACVIGPHPADHEDEALDDNFYQLYNALAFDA